MIKEVFGRSRRPLGEVLLDAIRELGKCYSRLELAYIKLSKREKRLFEECTLHLQRGLRERAIVYANEIAEIRKLISLVQSVQLSVEKAILRLETFKTVTPTLENIRSVFGEVKGALADAARIMPSMTPELNNLVNSINELMMSTELTATPREPLAIKDEAAEAILKEAADFLRQEMERRIPEPPEEIYAPEPSEATAIKPRIALTVYGSEVHVGEGGVVIDERGGYVSSLAEELVLDYIERNNGEMNISKCAKELNVPQAKVIEVLESLSRKGKIRIE